MAPVVWTFVTVCFGMSILLMFLPSPLQKAPESRHWYLLLGLLCCVATLLACLAGVWNFESHMSVFWFYEGSRAYENVLPTESALSHLDAGKVGFSSDSKVDDSNAVGFEDGSLYCVAPIVASEKQTQIEYWAVGVDCCKKKGGFTCGDIGNVEVHSGLVTNSHQAKFSKAVTMATEGNLTTSEDALYVRWVSDADSAQDAYWDQALGFFVGMCALHLLLSLVIGVLLHFGSRPSMAKGKQSQ